MADFQESRIRSSPAHRDRRRGNPSRAAADKMVRNIELAETPEANQRGGQLVYELLAPRNPNRAAVAFVASSAPICDEDPSLGADGCVPVVSQYIPGENQSSYRHQLLSSIGSSSPSANRRPASGARRGRRIRPGGPLSMRSSGISRWGRRKSVSRQP